MKTMPFSAYCPEPLIRHPLDLLWLPFTLCRAVFYAAAPFIWPSGIFRGIRTLDFNRKSRSSFDLKINDALAMIEQNDRRRFERVRREIRLIVYDRWLIEPLAPGAYFRLAKVCLINLKRFDFSKSPQFETALLAGLIVYLATHGVLHRKRLPNVDRVKALCHKEEVRLLLKLGYDMHGFSIIKP